LPYADKGYHQILATSLFKGTPLVKWSKKVAQWNSKLNGFCYLKQFMRRSRATIANCLGPFPKGSEIHSFAAFKHSNASNIITENTGPRTYHYRWKHKRTLGPQYLGRPDYQGHYEGISLDTLREQRILKERLGLKASEWAPAPCPEENPAWPRFPVVELEDAQISCHRCRTPGHKATHCLTIECSVCMEKGHSFKVCPKKQRKREPAEALSDGSQKKLGKLTKEERMRLKEQGACFMCQQSGHMAKACPRRIGSAEYGRPAPTLEEKRAALLEGLM
jgi:hypothetical protein